MDSSTIKKRLYVTVIALLVVATAGIFYKLHYLKFSLVPNEREALWQIEGRIEFIGNGETPIRVSLAAPERHPGYRLLSMDELSPRSYSFRFDNMGDLRRAEWLSLPAKGKQTVAFRMRIYDTLFSKDRLEGAPPELGPEPFWENEAASFVAHELVEQISADNAKPSQIVHAILKHVFQPEPGSRINILLPAPIHQGDRLELSLSLLRLAEIPARAVYGLQLVDGRRRVRIIPTVEAYFDGAWHGYDAENATTGFPEQYLALRRGDKSMFDVEGGSNSSIRFSIVRTTVPASVLTSSRTDTLGRTLASLSVYDLPLESQNAFKRIALIPIGILIVVIIRNLIGIQTMGTFMPVLIAMAFLDTTLIPGLISFMSIVVVGLLIRFYLERLNLLLVPRIAAVVLVVITLMKAFSLASHEIGFTQGLSVTLFPLIIMAWTIERASILWEEDGPYNTLKQFSASLGTGILCFFVMDSRHVQHLTFAFMEIDLIILAVILLLGSYTGYRLTELRRFKSLVMK